MSFHACLPLPFPKFSVGTIDRVPFRVSLCHPSDSWKSMRCCRYVARTVASVGIDASAASRSSFVLNFFASAVSQAIPLLIASFNLIGVFPPTVISIASRSMSCSIASCFFLTMTCL